jgi:indolepyruvate ferredoxin oxidoreductase
MMALHASRRLRETPFDLFGRTALRKTERQLHREYADLVRTLLAQLTHDNAGGVLAVARLPLQIRGYEDVKLKSIARYRGALAEHLRSITA